MSIFRNPNEAAYTSGRKHWTDVIKNSGPGNVLIWKQPEEDFNTNSTLIVMPGEEALFINGGIIEQIFENGTYTLTTENYPFISRLRNAFSGGISTFNCVVYFVRKSESCEIIWGTDSPIQVRDKVWGIRTDARVHGSYKVKIVNSAVFLEKLIGNKTNYQFQDDLSKYFRNEFQSKIKSLISKFLNELEQELIGIDTHLEEYSNIIEPQIGEILNMYGLECVKFSISGLDIDTDKYDALDKSQIELIARKRGYQGDKAGMEILGEDWAKIQGVNILKDMANNTGSGNGAAIIAGMGLGMESFGAISNLAQRAFSDEKIINQKSNQEDPMETLSKLKRMFDVGLIEQAEYDTKKAEILSRM